MITDSLHFSYIWNEFANLAEKNVSKNVFSIHLIIMILFGALSNAVLRYLRINQYMNILILNILNTWQCLNSEDSVGLQ